MFITLYVTKDCPYCEQVKWLLLEKNIAYKEVELSMKKDQEFISQHSPNSTLPILKERDVYFYDSRIIMFYLDERYPSPSLMPQYPVLRAKTRLALMRIDRDWYSILGMLNQKNEQAIKARNALIDSFTAISPIFAETEFFMSEELTIADGALSVLLKHLDIHGIKLDHCAEISKYAQRMFSRESFKQLNNK
jgi:stringent starvation protein A